MLNYLPFALLLLTVLSLWLPTKSGLQPWKPLFVVTLISGIYTGAANFIATISIVILYGLISIYAKASQRVKPLFWLLVFALAFTLELHLIRGVHNLLILDKVKITADAMPYTLYLNFDKTIAGLLIIGMTLSRVNSLANFILMLKQLFASITNNTDTILCFWLCQV